MAEGLLSSSEPGKGDEPRDAKISHHDQMIGIGVAIVGVILTYIIYRHSQSSSSSSPTYSSGPTGATIPASSGTVAGSAYGGSPYTDQMMSQFQSQLQAQANAISGLQTSIASMPAEATTTGPPANQTGTGVAPPPPAPVAATYTVPGMQVASAPVAATYVPGTVLQSSSTGGIVGAYGSGAPGQFAYGASGQPAVNLQWVGEGTPGSVPFAGSPTGYAVNPTWLAQHSQAA